MDTNNEPKPAKTMSTVVKVQTKHTTFRWVTLHEFNPEHAGDLEKTCQFAANIVTSLRSKGISARWRVATIKQYKVIAPPSLCVAVYRTRAAANRNAARLRRLCRQVGVVEI